MLYLLLAILGNVAVFLSFRSFTRFKINTFPAIVTNYLICVITGSIYVGFGNIKSNIAFDQPWFYSASALGLLFIGTFYLMALTTQLRGVAVATVATKMSLAIPVLFSLFILKIGTSELGPWNYIGIVTAFVAIFLVSKKKVSLEVKEPLSIGYVALPFVVFLMGGALDTWLNYASENLIEVHIEGIYPIITFGTAFIIGSIVILVKKIKVTKKEIMGGLYLGIPNYFSIYFQIKALSAFDNNGAVLYPVLNIGIIITSTILAAFIFREYPSKLNIIGIVLAIVALVLISV
ncbi:hypothetical protein [Roseivirga echinicomitans]|uniref:EamA domain-containing protein n=1 Tax=Roseivirga echinicomitans TaxID=296218 RepID=A0A150XJA6_9BACT|nr:hypothetical protein [Roseivirga echinicomitans]KYG78796.1 hypothetical protein AWN68_03975 [Roseivirga echinicomitans]